MRVSEEENPADLATRGISTKVFKSISLWLCGPDIIRNSVDVFVTVVILDKVVETVSYGYSLPTAIVDNTIQRTEQILSYNRLLNVAVCLLRFTGRSQLKGQLIAIEKNWH